MQNNKIILPGETIGIIGGGQLGRMMAIAAKYMGYNVVVLDPTPNCPTAQVADQQIIAEYNDIAAINELTSISSVVTYEFENVDLRAAAMIEQEGKLPQGAYPLAITQNREKEKHLMEEVNLPVPNFAIVHHRDEVVQALEHLPFPLVIKTCQGGYDGKGQLKLESSLDLSEAIQFVEQHQHCIVEAWISFDKEISVIFTRSKTGEIVFFPIAENIHKDQILYQTIVPANISVSVKEKALAAARALAEKMDIVGTFTIEMFVAGEKVYLNEMAPRPHNSGHYTIEACNVSQFAQHIRAICGLPLVPVELIKPATMLNILGENFNQIIKAIPKINQGFVHFYGKEAVKAKRKMGHITFIGDNLAEKVESLRRQLND
ncbi:5-(carboxyamino)imidazole ribonucleotide synthase [Ornithinibacillus bavariensis]|uniref:N5-carboxyaminoimidazole ribonucleotide synthase n=1 Tax=Ornithinibacillus bavariensis TaxID=545502 RepID=A0A919X9F3_9BACI|nr:5-(carboxyamino)imidazole ribonucleotide synthase [Ornithinibacillus bavariensis]GIO28021.1 N5-carboxyaminoimidazole ribonucleotide synthase [Ornithinibacillus bavariensis]